mgnify:CR=1 FL=1
MILNIQKNEFSKLVGEGPEHLHGTKQEEEPHASN